MNLPNRLPTASMVVRRHKPWTIRNAAQAKAAPPPLHSGMTRRYEVTWIDDNGNLDNFMRVAPAIPIFEQAFSAFAHGAMIATAEGSVPVEDLVPGTQVETAAGTFETLRWVGAMTLIPGAQDSEDNPQKLYRVTADSFGLSRPMVDVTFGPAARILNRDPSVLQALGAEAALAPIAALADGISVVALNLLSPVRAYHLAFDGHHVIKAGGLEVESYHPGPDAHYSMSQELRGVFLSLFPHMDNLQGFGRVLWPRFETQAGGEYELV